MENIQWQRQPVVAAVDAHVQNHSMYTTVRDSGGGRVLAGRVTPHRLS